MVLRFVLALAIAMAFLAPTAVRAQSSADLLIADLDAWWAQQFADRGLAYNSPVFEIVSEPNTEFCGFLDVYYSIAGFCASNDTITLSEGLISPDNIIGILPILSHEFGHHIQNITDTGITTSFESEQQADCFAGAFIAYAADSGLVSPVLSAIALQITQAAGDVWWAVPFEESIHGTQSQRAEAFLTGQLGGLEACGF